MKTTYAVSQNPDSYEAGIEIAEALKMIEPEMVILFSSINYDFEELFSAFYSVLPQDRTRIWGGTGDGIYSTEGAFNYSVAAIGINSEGKIQWQPEVCDDTELDSRAKAKSCAQAICANSSGMLKAGLVAADFQNDGVALTEELNEILNCPLVGGLTGDDWQFKLGYVFQNGKIFQNAVSVLGMSGDFSFDCHSASGWKPIGRTGIITKATDNIIHEIDGKTAYKYMEEEFGVPPAEAELGVIPLAAYTDSQNKHFFLRTPSNIDLKTGELTFFGTIPEGTTVQVCTATKEDVLEGVDAVLAAISNPDFKPKAAILISCGGRKWILQQEIDQEIKRFQAVFGKSFPIVGFNSFGEIGPFKINTESWSPAYFHNVSYVVFLFGEHN